MGKTTSPVKSARRVVQLLEFFDDIRRGARVSEISASLSYPQSSTSILLKCLTELGYLEYNARNHTYLPTPRVTLLGSWLGHGPIRNGKIMRLLEELSEITGKTVILAAKNGIFSQYIHLHRSVESAPSYAPPKSPQLLVRSATGFALLVDSPDKDIISLVRRTNADALAGQTPIDVNTTLANVMRLKRFGYYFSRGLIVSNSLGSIAMPLPKGIDLGGGSLAVALTGPLPDFIRSEIKIVRQIDDAIKRHLTAPH
jgi:DNA-binding IclR family transcriptional regulator